MTGADRKRGRGLAHCPAYSTLNLGNTIHIPSRISDKEITARMLCAALSEFGLCRLLIDNLFMRNLQLHPTSDGKMEKYDIPRETCVPSKVRREEEQERVQMRHHNVVIALGIPVPKTLAVLSSRTILDRCERIRASLTSGPLSSYGVLTRHVDPAGQSRSPAFERTTCWVPPTGCRFSPSGSVGIHGANATFLRWFRFGRSQLLVASVPVAVS